MQFKDSQRDAIVRGDVTLTFRRWLRPQVRLNGSYRKRHWGGAIVVDGLTALPGANPELEFSAADVHRTGAADVATLRAEIERHTAKTAGKRTLYRN